MPCEFVSGWKGRSLFEEGLCGCLICIFGALCGQSHLPQQHHSACRLAKRISISFFRVSRWINFSKVLSLSVSISSSVRKPSVLHLGNLMALTSSLVSPYFALFSSILCFRSSLVGLLLVLMMKLFLRVTPVFFMLSWNTFSRCRCSPMKSPSDCWPNNRCVCMQICPIDLPARHFEFTIFLHLPSPNFCSASFRICTSSGFHPGERVQFHKLLDWLCSIFLDMLYLRLE